MKMKAIVGIVTFAVSAMIFAADGAAAQAPAPSSQSGASSQSDANKSPVEGPAGGNPAVRQKRVACASEAQSKSLKGESLDSFMKECMKK